MSISEVILKCRAEHNLTQSDVGEAFGVTKQAVHKWEQSESIPALETVMVPLAQDSNGWARQLAMDLLNVHPYFVVLIPKDSIETQS